MRKVRQAIWLVLGMFAVVYLSGALVDMYKMFTPAGLTGRCYSLETPSTRARDYTVKIVANDDQYAVVQMLDFSSRHVSISHWELRQRNLQEVKCEKTN